MFSFSIPSYRWLLPVLFITFTGCGSASDQEVNRKKLLEGLNDHRIKRVTEEQIHSEAYAQGQHIVDILNMEQRDSEFWMMPNGQAFLDSLNELVSHDGIDLLTQNSPSTEINTEERALLDAYQYSSEQGQLPGGNVQAFQENYLLYTSPVIRDSVFVGMWRIRLLKKTIVRNL